MLFKEKKNEENMSSVLTHSSQKLASLEKNYCYKVFPQGKKLRVLSFSGKKWINLKANRYERLLTQYVTEINLPSLEASPKSFADCLPSLYFCSR